MVPPLWLYCCYIGFHFDTGPKIGAYWSEAASSSDESVADTESDPSTSSRLIAPSSDQTVADTESAPSTSRFMKIPVPPRPSQLADNTAATTKEICIGVSSPNQPQKRQAEIAEG